MIINKYGLTLKRVTEDDIETIRLGRNSDLVRKRMLAQELISTDQQKEWFQRINSSRHCLYFTIQHNGRKIGVAHSKDIDWEKQEDEGGIFVWDERYIGSGIPTIASIIMMQLCFSIVGLQRTYARILPGNTDIQKYNLALGYTFTPEHGRMVLTRAAYDSHIDKLRKIASRGQDTSPLSLNDIIIEESDKKTPLFTDMPPCLAAIPGLDQI